MTDKPANNNRAATVMDLRSAIKDGHAVRGVLFRAATIGNIDVEKRTVELAFSSEAPVDHWGFTEILDHSKESVDMDWVISGRAPFLADHNMTIQIGVIESAEISKDRVGRAVVRFGKGAQADAYFQDVVDGIRTNISVGYSIDRVILEEETDTSATYRVMRWKPLEISLVSIPADQTVGIGRSEDIGREHLTISLKQPPMEKRTMTTENQLSAANAPSVPAAPIISAEQVRKEEITRIREMTALGAKHGFAEKAQEYIAEGKRTEEFRSYVLDNLSNKPISTLSKDDGKLGMSDKEARGYSFLRVMRYLADPTNQRAFEDCAFEREVSEAVATKYKGRTFKGNIQVPTDVLFAPRSMQPNGKRDLNVGAGSAGGYMVATELDSGNFIELLRNRLLVRQLGARVLGGLEGNLALPKQTGGATAYWVTEGGDVTESQQTIGQVVMQPKTVGALTEFTRRMLMQASPDVENFVRLDLVATLGTAIDKAALVGTGSGGQPLGIANTSGIGVVTITSGTFTEAKMIDLESEVSIDNADLGKLAYLATAGDRGKMKKTDIGTDTGKRIWTNAAGMPGVGEVNGYLAYATNQLTDNTVIFGNWDELMIGEWGVLDLLVNPYAKDASGGIRVRALQDVDVAVRHPESFAKTSV